MSKLEELIQKYCPDGVEYHKIKEVYKRIKGTPITAGKMKEIAAPDGSVRIFAGGKTVIDANEEDIPNANITRVPAVLVQSRGVIDAVYYDKPFTFKNEMWAYTTSNQKSVKYLYYVLKKNIQVFRDAASGMGSLPQISLGVTEDFVIPIPPLPVQEEIVRVLDTFTELQAELQAELQKRLQQYNYYRDNLLSDFTPEQDPREYTLEEITTDIYSGATPSKEKRDYWENGTIPWMSSGEVNLGQVYEVEGRITQLGYDKCSTRMVPEGSVVIALAGQGKTRGTVAILRTSVCTNQSLAALVPNPEIVSGEYLYYYLKTQYSKLREVSSGDGTRGGLNLKMLRSYKVIVPSLKTQAQIVSILERFDTLTNDLTSGLPAEIEKRRQQYEFYRDKLLTFKRIGND